MARKPRPLDRTKQHERDTRLYFIATEGELTEKQYFDGVFSSPRYQFHFLTTPGQGAESQGCSSPQHVIDRLNEIKKSTEYEPGDEFWLVIDTDCYTKSNKIAHLTRVTSEAKRRGYQLAISNPSIEVWLYLHHMKLTPAEIDGKLNREYFEDKLRDLLGSFNRKNLNADNFKTRVETACRNARTKDTSKTKPWPLKTGSHVYRLVEKLLKEK